MGMDAEVRMMLIPSRLLVFDEPTNHLDVPMKDTDTYVVRMRAMAIMSWQGQLVPPCSKVPHWFEIWVRPAMKKPLFLGRVRGFRGTVGWLAVNVKGGRLKTLQKSRCVFFLVGWFQMFVIFTTTWGNDPVWLCLTNIFQMGWFNHHLFFCFGWELLDHWVDEEVW